MIMFTQKEKNQRRINDIADDLRRLDMPCLAGFTTAMIVIFRLIHYINNKFNNIVFI